MPHRQGLGDLATDQKAETELGRLVLRKCISPELGLAGDTYASQWAAYLFTLGVPQSLRNGHAQPFSCDGCEDDEARRYCRCALRARIFIETRRVLIERAGIMTAQAVWVTVMLDRPALDLVALRHGLEVLARHFGLINNNALSQESRPASPPGALRLSLSPGHTADSATLVGDATADK